MVNRNMCNSEECVMGSMALKIIVAVLAMIGLSFLLVKGMFIYGDVSTLNPRTTQLEEKLHEQENYLIEGFTNVKSRFETIESENINTTNKLYRLIEQQSKDIKELQDLVKDKTVYYSVAYE